MIDFKIPKSFQLFGRTYRVEHDEKLLVQRNLLGEIDYEKGLIKLAVQTEDNEIPSDHEAQIFFHELVHAVFKAAGEDGYDPPLHKREELVDRVASLLHQAITTMEV